jgi:RNA polymerase sigma-70 factor (ECF subfamily)
MGRHGRVGKHEEDGRSDRAALGDAFAAALAQWPSAGVPANPEGWLVAAARRRLADGRRRTAVRDAAAAELTYAATLTGSPAGVASPGDAAGEPSAFPDRRLGLLFACAHPAIDPGVHTPLMLQAVLGLDAAAVASAFLVAPAAMAQRLVRAKRKLRDAGVPFEVPAADALAPRLAAVLAAIYAAFGAGWDAVTGGDVQSGPGAAAASQADLADEAIWLGRLVVDALPDEPEARGLLALMLYCHARRDARTGAAGAGLAAGPVYVPLAAQDPARWALPLIGEAEAALRAAARHLRPGRYQLEAAIQSAHLAPAFGRPADWAAVVALYDALLAYAPTVGAVVGRAAAVGEAVGPEAGLAASEGVPAAAAASYQPWWALRAHLLARLGRADEAGAAYARAAGLTRSPAVRTFLLARADALPRLGGRSGQA